MIYDIVIEATVESNLPYEELKRRLIAWILDGDWEFIMNFPWDKFKVIDYQKTEPTPQCDHLDYDTNLDWYKCKDCGMECS